MKTVEQLKKEIAGLEVKYQASVTRNVYKIGNKLRVAQTELHLKEMYEHAMNLGDSIGRIMIEERMDKLNIKYK